MKYFMRLGGDKHLDVLTNRVVRGWDSTHCKVQGGTACLLTSPGDCFYFSMDAVIGPVGQR